MAARALVVPFALAATSGQRVSDVICNRRSIHTHFKRLAHILRIIFLFDKSDFRNSCTLKLLSYIPTFFQGITLDFYTPCFVMGLQ